MMKKLIIITTFFTCWIILAQSCMKMRISDAKAKKEFFKKKPGVSIQWKDIIGNMKMNGRHHDEMVYFAYGVIGFRLTMPIQSFEK